MREKEEDYAHLGSHTVILIVVFWLGCKSHDHALHCPALIKSKKVLLRDGYRAYLGGYLAI